jgi:hypothetical protein
MRYILTFLLLFLFNVGYAQTVAYHYQTPKFDVAIFPKDVPDAMNVFLTAYTPTTSEVDSMEMALYQYLKRMRRKLKSNPCQINVYKNFKNYRRQYFGFKNDSGEKLLFINSYNPKDSSFTFDWLNTQVIVFDGGSTYWNVHYNYTKKGFYNLSINGSG